MLTCKPIIAKGIGPESMICLFQLGFTPRVREKGHILLSHGGAPGYLNLTQVGIQKEEIKSDLR